MQKGSLLLNSWRGLIKKMAGLFHNPYREVNINWFKLKYYKHLPAGKLRRHKLNGKYIYFQSAGEFLHGVKEIFLEKIYKQDLPPTAVILDCGANIGLSVIYLKNRFPDAMIHAFEPDEANFNLLEKNISSFGFKNVFLHKKAVWKENTQLHFSDDASMSSRIEKASTISTKMVEAVRLRDFIDKKIDFLKLDIEGAEFDVIIDIKDQLHLVDHLFVEYHGSFKQVSELTKIFEILTEKGFYYYIKEAAPVYHTPFTKEKNPGIPYDIQLNIFCFRE